MSIDNPENPEPPTEEAAPEPASKEAPKKSGKSKIGMITNLVVLAGVGGAYYYFIHHIPGPGEWDDAAIEEWISTEHNVQDVEWDKESPKDIDMLGTEFEVHKGTVKKNSDECSVTLAQHEDARLVISESSCFNTENPMAELKEILKVKTHYAFGPLPVIGTINPEGCANQELQSLLSVFLNTPNYASADDWVKAEDGYFRQVDSTLNITKSEFKDDCKDIFEHIEEKVEEWKKEKAERDSEE